ncbi:hypothetical protein F5B17DRAFT_315451 [Nemania serpens]|nr:hypothetical protein F5B17DRAFT_315451 [Nemania serpens]
MWKTSSTKASGHDAGIYLEGDVSTSSYGHTGWVHGTRRVVLYIVCIYVWMFVARFTLLFLLGFVLVFVCISVLILVLIFVSIFASSSGTPRSEAKDEWNNNL